MRKLISSRNKLEVAIVKESSSVRELKSSHSRVLFRVQQHTTMCCKYEFFPMPRMMPAWVNSKEEDNLVCMSQKVQISIMITSVCQK